MTTVFLVMVLWLAPGELGVESVRQEATILKPGDRIWVGHGMAKGYDLPFRQELTIKKARYLFMKEVRVVFEEYPRRFYLRSDFGPNYAFREDPEKTYAFSPEQWEEIRRGTISVGMSKKIFLLVLPKSEEIHVRQDPDGAVEQWIYREHPKDLYDVKENPPTQIYFFQKNILISIL